ncbi:hypothetical protein C7S15_7899 [Burkholderia cepacia]|nr:hypothetical protein [Burkholderia cepacia]
MGISGVALRDFGTGAPPNGIGVEKHAELHFNIGLYFRILSIAESNWPAE